MTQSGERRHDPGLPPLEIFCSYAHRDESLRHELEQHLSLLSRQGIATLWHDRQITPGTDWSQEIDTHLETTSLLLLLISSDFLASDYCYGIEMQRALQRYKAKEACVIPILVRPCDWKYAPFASLQVLPTRAKPITRWRDRDAAWTDVVTSIRHALDERSQVATTVPRSSGSEVWNIPFPRNPFFTGRDDLLEQLHTQLRTVYTAALGQPQAISGLGGIGKTQIAIEYAYRYRQEYQAVLWARADTTEALNTSYTEIAGLLNLPQKDAQEQEVLVQAVKDWLSGRQDWLLILDNADDLAIVRPFLPTTFAGHLLLTSRAQTVAKLARRLEVDTMDQEAGASLLVRRAGLIALDASLDVASPADRGIAYEITEELGGLPLALDQAGAYMEETGCGLVGYQRLYRTQRVKVLDVRGGFVDDHPAPVTATWSLSFERVEQRNPAAADLLRLCAFLAPDTIPEEILAKGAAELGDRLAPVAADPFQLNGAIAVLRAYSLLARDSATNALSIHRLVQVVVGDALSVELQRQWKQRAILALNATFPDGSFASWPICERLLPHTLYSIIWIEQEHLEMPEAARLLNKAGSYLCARARYGEAEPLLQRALAICEQRSGPMHLDTATSLASLGELYLAYGKDIEAEPLLQRALAIREQKLGLEHPDTARSSNNLALLYLTQRKDEEAEPLLQRTLATCEQKLGPEHPDTASSLNNLALLYRAQGKYGEAKPLLQRALAIREAQLGPVHPDTASSLTNLGEFYRTQGKYEEAEPLLQRALAIQEQKLEPEHPDTATSRNNLALLHSQQKRPFGMRVYCPCGKKCFAYSGSVRKCSIIEVSQSVPHRFMYHLGRKTGKAIASGDWLTGTAGALSTIGVGWLSSLDDTSYEVWQCRGCHCEVLYQITKQGGGIRKEELGKISSCKE